MLRLPRFRLLEPRSYGEAAQLLAENGAGALDRSRGTSTLRVMLVAGGTDLFPKLKRRQFDPDTLVGLAHLSALRDTTAHAAGGFELGALVTLAEATENAGLAEAHPGYVEAAGQCSSRVAPTSFPS